ncbi:MAG: hypothetical protein ACRD4B_07540, partial [Acidobacteriota bacterium]
PNDHTTIDRDAEAYPIERLHQIKDQHELWVAETLSGSADQKEIVNELIYSNLVDSASELCGFPNWENWISLAFSEPPAFREELYYGIDKFGRIIAKAIWPNTIPELESALRTLALILPEARDKFFEHAVLDREKIIRGIKFYQIPEWNPELYKELGDQYDQWCEEYRSLMYEATKVANWVAEVVRREINPMFFAMQGKFMLIIPDGLGYSMHVPEFTPEEKGSVFDQVNDRVRKKWDEDRKPYEDD